LAHAQISLAGAAALSSYKPTETGKLKVISGGVGDTQTAACWVAVTDDGSHAYTVNTASGTVSLYSVSIGGQLSLVNPTAGGGNVPVDAALSHGSRFLYVRNGGDGTISGFRVRTDGTLKLIDVARGLPMGAAGLAAN
jgi:6-phosphogluconolactonase (cycloisomerase 2 family)